VEQEYPDTDLVAYCRKTCTTGVVCEDCPRPRLLPESLLPLRAYATCGTQWRTGFNGATGLDYASCIATLERYAPRWEKEQPPAEPIDPLDLLDEVRTIEQALLLAWAEQAEKKRETDDTKAADE